MITLQPIVELGLLVGVETKREPGLFEMDDSLAELRRLAETAGVTVVDVITQSISQPNPATYIGKGKLEEVVLRVREQGVQVVIFDHPLSPRQQREIEKALEKGGGGEEANPVKVLDRTALILDIFAQHAHTREGALQVELAQYEYRLPRLTRAWTHLARQAGGRAGGAGMSTSSGGVGVRGPGETQLEVDRREIGRRIALLRREIEEVRTHRQQYRSRRRASNTPLVALVGYTNAGKSTLLNTLSQASDENAVLAADQLFATLDPTTRRLTLPSGREALMTDTVGFIQKLPTQLIAAFRATLEEILDADLLLHVVDVSHPNVLEQAAAVEEVLEELGAFEPERSGPERSGPERSEGSLQAGEGLPLLVALNKVDLIPGGQLDPEVEASLPGGVPVSALSGQGLEALLDQIDVILAEAMAPIEVLIPYDSGELVDLFHRRGLVSREEHRPDGTLLAGRLPPAELARFRPYVTRRRKS
ncbi:MAG: GTPase HflX [Caldilineales bacterium]|nr:GTPase HflX [Caldilineales bacterium]